MRHDQNARQDSDTTPLLLTSFDTAPPPVAHVHLGYTFIASGLTGYVTAPFRGYDPAVKGQLTLDLGYSAAAAAGAVASLAPLKHVLAGSTVADPTSLIDLSFTTPGQSYLLGAETQTKVDVGISSSTNGLSGILGPLTAALAGTALGNDLAPVVKFGKGLLPTLDKNGGVPHGGSLTATQYLALNAGVALSQTLTVLGQTTTTQQSGSLTVNGQSSAAAGQALSDTAVLLGNAGTLLSDVQAGNLVGAVPAGVATLASGAAVIGDIGTLLTDAQQQHNPVLPAIKDAALNLNVHLEAGQTFGLGVGDPTQVTETLGVKVTADTFGAYALGKLLAQVAPQLVAGLANQGTVQQPLTVLSQMAGDVATLAQDAGNGFAGLGGAGAIPSSTTHADIGIQLTFSVSESQNLLTGSVANTQTFTTDLQTNAQGFYDLGTTAQPVITDLLIGLLETPGGREALQIGGSIVSQIDHKLGATSAVMPVHWHT
jgi:hypothetical protein